jgi:hypothetical protein
MGEKMKEDMNRLIKAFPSSLVKDVQAVLNIIPQTKELTYSSNFYYVKLCGETLYIPERIYYDEPSLIQIRSLTNRQQKILNTLFTRHSNGF